MIRRRLVALAIAPSGRRTVRTFLIAAIAITLAAAASPVCAASWSEACAADSDTTVFFAGDGTLLRGPFHLATRETLWTPAPGERLVRVRVSPDGRQVAWLSAVEGRDSTTLWVAGDTPARALARYLPLQPGRYGVLHYEAPIPSVQDADIAGGRLIQPNVHMRGLDAYVLEWTPDSHALVIGHTRGLSAITVEGGDAFPVNGALATSLEPLAPAPFYLVRAIVQRGQAAPDAPEGQLGEQVSPMPNGARATNRAEQASYLLYPLPHRWRVYPGSAFDPEERHAANDVTAWYASGGKLRAVRVDDPREQVVADVGGRTFWLGTDASRREVLWASEKGLYAHAEEGGATRTLRRPHGPVRAAFTSRDGAVVGVVSDSLLVWDVAAGEGQSFALGGLDPVALYRTPDGALAVLTATHGKASGLARVDFAAHQLQPTGPSVANAAVAQSPSGRLLLLYDPAATAPARVHVYDAASQRWTDADNPGITGWEPLTPR